MRILITGGRGQLAGDLKELLEGHEVSALGREDLDIADPDSIEAAMESYAPDVVINTAAFHNVDACEGEPEASFAINAAAVRRLADACASREGYFVHLSTDYVFDGDKTQPYTEDDTVAPINVYGCSKAAGEMAVRCAMPGHLVVRTTGLYGFRAMGASRSNFVETMLRLAASGQTMSVVSDQVLTPSYTADVAAAIFQLVLIGATGTYHVTNAGACSWYEFARQIFRLTNLDVDLRPVRQAERPSPARRPSYSVLSHQKLESAGIPALRPWSDALSDYIQERTIPLFSS